MKTDKIDKLKSLGSKETTYIYDKPDAFLLETFPNQYPEREYQVEYLFNEFTSLCPRTGQPDFATIKVKYIPDKLCIETKSLKLYFLAFRQYGSFMETITNKILEDCWAVSNPRRMEINAEFNPRGGTLIKITAQKQHRNENISRRTNW